MKAANRPQLMVFALITALVWFAAGCATSPNTGKRVYYYFPPPPDDPHFQYLTAFSSEKQFRGGEDRNFMSYVTGVKPLQRELAKPYGVAAHDHKVYICDTDYGTIIVLDLTTRRMTLFDAEGEGALKLPLNMCVDADGTTYVADADRDQIVVFDGKQNYVAAIGKQGEMKPRDVAVGKDKIYVADLQSHSVRVFDKASRTALFSIPHGLDATNHARQIFTPTNLGIDSQGNLYVADTGAFRVLVFDADGNYLRTVGEFGDGPGQFARLKGISLDREGRLYTVDAMSQVVQVFDPQGQLLTWFGDPTASKATQNLPAKVMVDYEDVDFFKDYVAPGFKIQYLVFVINQLGPHKVSVYGFGDKK